MGKYANSRLNPVKVCRCCGVILEPGVNCHINRFKISHYICSKCSGKNWIEYCKKHPEKRVLIKTNTNKNRKLGPIRLQALKRLGDKCVRCEFSDARALQIDHIHGGGTQERRKIGTLGVYTKILKMKNPHKEYQVLCSNCNWIKRVERKEHP